MLANNNGCYLSKAEGRMSKATPLCIGVAFECFMNSHLDELSDRSLKILFILDSPNCVGLTIVAVIIFGYK